MDDYNFFDDTLTREDVQRLAQETTLNTLQAITQSNAIVQQNKMAAIAEASEKYPEFVELYSSHEITSQFVVKKPTLARMILTAEAQGSDALPELYGSFVTAVRTLGLADKTEQRTQDPRPSKAADSTKDLSTSESRQALIRSFEERYGDVPVDLADDSDEGRKTRRY